MLIARVIEEARTADSETEAKRSGFLTLTLDASGKYRPAKSLTSNVRCEIKNDRGEPIDWNDRYGILQDEDSLYDWCDEVGGLPRNWGSYAEPVSWMEISGNLFYWDIRGRLIHKQGATEWAQVTPELAIKRMIDFAFSQAPGGASHLFDGPDYQEEIGSAQIVVAKFLIHLAILSRDRFELSSLSTNQIYGESMWDLYDHNYQKILPCGILAQVAIAGKIFYETPGEDFEYSPL